MNSVIGLTRFWGCNDEQKSQEQAREGQPRWMGHDLSKTVTHERVSSYYTVGCDARSEHLCIHPHSPPCDPAPTRFAFSLPPSARHEEICLVVTTMTRSPSIPWNIRTLKLGLLKWYRWPLPSHKYWYDHRVHMTPTFKIKWAFVRDKVRNLACMLTALLIES